MFAKYNFESRGIGIIASKEIPKNTSIGIYYSKTEPITEETRLIYDGWVETNPLGKYINHNRNRNCEIYFFNKDEIRLVTNKDIRLHEELTINYLDIIKAINLPEELANKYNIRDFDYIEEDVKL